MRSTSRICAKATQAAMSGKFVVIEDLASTPTSTYNKLLSADLIIRLAGGICVAGLTNTEVKMCDSFEKPDANQQQKTLIWRMLTRTQTG